MTKFVMGLKATKTGRQSPLSARRESPTVSQEKPLTGFLRLCKLTGKLFAKMQGLRPWGLGLISLILQGLRRPLPLTL
jgi:hypothetical protein